MKIIESDFMDKSYYNIYQYCKKIFGDKNVSLEGNKEDGFRALNVSGDIVMRLSFSGNEFKVYFGNFRITDFQGVIQYLDFKATELELIKSIEG